jgi:hypothetical protein
MMFETILAIFIGYVVGRLVSQPGKSMRVPDKILRWDSNILGYRVLMPNEKVTDSTTYLLCYEVNSSDKKR